MWRPDPCQLGSWMPPTGRFEGDFTGCSEPCSNGTVGTRPDHTSSDCGGLCPAGHYCEKGTVEPKPCPEGRYTPSQGATSLAACIRCDQGSFQPKKGSIACSSCPAGTYTERAGATECFECPPGGYCEEAGAATSKVWKPCGSGTFNPDRGSDSPDACLKCPAGTASSATGQHHSSICERCRPGTFTADVGQSTCERCPAGASSLAGATECKLCQQGEYASEAGQSACVTCPHPLSSPIGSVDCPVCLEDFYMRDPGVNSADMMANPDQHCKPCPPFANCSAFNSSLAFLGVPENYWRASVKTAKLYPCLDSEACAGSANPAFSRRRAQADHTAESMYCKTGHTGPRCEVCVESGQHFNRSSGRCVDCPSRSRFAIMAGVVVGTVLFLAGLNIAIKRLPHYYLDRVCNVQRSIGFQPKFKILVSFYQVVATLTNVYGIRLHPAFTSWLDVLDDLNLDLVDLSFPATCVGSMETRLLITAFWPYALVLATTVGITAHALVKRYVRRRSKESEPHTDESTSLSNQGAELSTDTSLMVSLSFRSSKYFIRAVRARCLYALVLVFYLVLPSVSRSIFKARQCESFAYDDETGRRISFLLADLSLTCNSGPGWSNESAGLQAYFWPLFVLWPVAVPIGFLMLLLPTRSALRSKRITMLARASSFLWRDYEPALLFWEVIDMYRKVPSPESRQMEHALTPPFPPWCSLDLPHSRCSLHRHGERGQQIAASRHRHRRLRPLPCHGRRGPPVQRRRRPQPGHHGQPTARLLLHGGHGTPVVRGAAVE